jgi:PAS domain S-box-containing protein
VATEPSSDGECDARFRTTFEQAAIGIAHVDPEGRWLEANPRLCEIVGYSSAELSSLTLRDLTHPDDLDADLEYFRRVLSDKIRAYSLQKRYVRKDGTPVWIELTSSLVRDSEGNPSYFIKLVRLLSETSQQDLRAARGIVTTGGVVSRGTMFDDVAYDLDGLLLVIQSYAELSMSGLPHSSPLGQDLRQIQRAALRAHELTRYLVKMARGLGPE